jgi:hypothetical protein
MSNDQNIPGKNFRSVYSPLHIVVVWGHIHILVVVLLMLP